MRASILGALITIAVATPAAAADITRDDLLLPGKRDAAVEKSSRFQGLDRRVIYLKPGTAFNPGDKLNLKLPKEERPPMLSGSRTSNGVIFGGLLVVVILLMVMFGGRIQVSFRGTNEGRRSSVADGPAERLAGMEDVPEDAELSYFTRMPDRRQALILMTGRVLERAAVANNLRLGRAQTARDVLQVLPGSWRLSGNVRQLVRHAEVVHFGGRDLAEETWADCVELARPLFGHGHRGRA